MSSPFFENPVSYETGFFVLWQFFYFFVDSSDQSQKGD